jgi:hypothetical protein
MSIKVSYRFPRFLVFNLMDEKGWPIMKIIGNGDRRKRDLQ